MSSFLWTRDLLEAVRLQLLGYEMDFTRGFAEGDHSEAILPGLYQVKAAGAAAAVMLIEQGKAIPRDTNDYPTAGLYLEPGDVERFRVRAPANLQIEVDTGGTCQLRRLAS